MALNYSTQTTLETTRTANRAFVSKIKSAEGRKEASRNTNAFVRERLRERGVARRLFGAIEVSDDMLDPSTSTDDPRIIVEKEPDSKAYSVPFYGAADLREIRGERTSVYFGKTITDEWEKNVHQLSTYKTDIRKVIMDNLVYDLADQEDAQLYGILQQIIAANPGQSIAAGSPTLTRDGVALAAKRLASEQLPVGTIVCTKSLFYDLLRLDATDVGDDIARRHYDQGVEGQETLWGFPVITTIKNDIFADNELWMFPTQEFLGYFYLLQDATVHIEQKMDIVRMQAYALPGISIINSRGVTRVTFS